MRSNFWMFLAQGCKHWITFHPDDANLLSPRFDEEDQICRFRPLSELEVDAKARRLDFTIEAGDVLFIPRGTPHEVKNLTATCSYSANFFDQSNIAEVLQHTRARLAYREEGSTGHSNLAHVLSALEEIDFPSLEDDLRPDDEATLAGEQMVGCFPCHEPLKQNKPVSIGRCA
eukprot:gnl/TRDRNA2_/TRDRNA2_125187_c0_seq2.p1 gnl/TRDRNA2_/TRDRNA2_125187_c0~~gnl/TRDRNA2_/TRDRNA2_125187_c0_seq2.p1  ORF type:complete len:173 (+),score=43.40 gnl/TRDRNA2_/TRDRNA2_125187_c0_seq2:2-520(+)